MFLETIRRYLPPPHYEDEDQNRVAILLYYILLVLGALALILTPITIFQPHPLPSMLPGILTLLIAAALYRLIRTGYLRLATIILPTLLWVNVAASMFFFGGVTSSTINLFVIVLLMAGVLIGTRAALIFLALTALAAAAAVMAEAIGWLPTDQDMLDPIIGSLLAHTANLAMVIFLVHISNRSLRSVLLRARKSEAYWRGVYDQAPLRVMVVAPDLTIESSNRTPAATEGKSLLDYVPLEQKDQVRQMIEAVVKTGEPFTFESPGITIHGEPAWFEVSVGPVIVDNEVQNLIVVVNNITARKKAEQALTEAHAEIARHREQLEEMVAARTTELAEVNQELRALGQVKDDFVANVSHELMTPITNTVLHVHLARSNLAGALPHLDIVQRETKRLALIIDDLLQLSRLDQGSVLMTFEPVDINKLVSDIHLDRQELASRHELSLHVDLVDDLPPVRGDYGLLSQTLSILLTNALNYTPQGGEVTIMTRRRKQKNTEWVGFSVKDTGLGIAPEDEETLFKRFARGKASQRTQRPGTGLGLPIALEIVVRHDGMLQLEPPLDGEGGAHFCVWLPPMV